MFGVVGVRSSGTLRRCLRQRKSVDGQMAILIGALGPLRENDIVGYLRKVGVSPNRTRGVMACLSKTSAYERLVGQHSDGRWYLESAGQDWYRQEIGGDPI